MARSAKEISMLKDLMTKKQIEFDNEVTRIGLEFEAREASLEK